MNTPLRQLGIVFLLYCASAPQAAQPDAGNAGDLCEEAVADTVRRMRGKQAQEVQFIGAKRALSPTLGDETGVKGEGRYHGAAGGTVSFSYSCAYNAKTGDTSGVVFRDIDRAAANAEGSWQPDLTHISPDACDAATAAALKEKYPRVGRIAFGSDTRRLTPGANDNTSLEGQGAVQRAPGMNAIPFTYRCEFQTRNGELVSVQTDD